MDLYFSPYAGPSRAVLMTGKALGVEFNRKILNIKANEQMSPEFLKINPQHTIPTLVDTGFILWESRAILTYLVEKYGKDDSLYPKNPKEQAVVNQRLYFDMGSLYMACYEYYFPQFRKNTPGDPELLKKVETALDFLNTFLEGQLYVAGDRLTIADISILATLSIYTIMGFLEFGKYPNIARWYENAKQVTPGWDENEKNLLEFKSFFK